MTHLVPVTCPACFEVFEVAAPFIDEVPTDVDYDCEVCCRPLRISFWEEDGEVLGEGYGLGD
jgi:Cysteine-rich CPXCG